MDAEAYEWFLERLIAAAGWRKGRGNKPHLQLIHGLVELFQAFETEGIGRPTNYINAGHVRDGRLLELLGRHGMLPRDWVTYALELDVQGSVMSLPNGAHEKYGIPRREPHELTARQELDALGVKMRRLFILAEKTRRDIFVGVTST